MTDDKSYTSFAKARYRDLFIDLMVRSHRASVMMYKDARAAEKRFQGYTFYIPRATTLFGALAAGVGLLKKFETSLYTNKLGKGGVAIVVFSCVMDYVVTQTDVMKDYLSKQANTYVNAASGWQKIMQTASAYLIAIDNPQVQIADIEEKYLQLVNERAEITKNVIVSKETYEKANNEDTIKDLCSRKELLQDAKNTIDFPVWPQSAHSEA